MSTRIRKESKMMRKQPQQARSQETVLAIIMAATQVLGRRGWANFNTNEVASVAGVSIGSLYQYFPNKLALVEAIRVRHFDCILNVFSRLEPVGQDRSELAETLLRGMFEAHAGSPRLHVALLEEAPRAAGSTAHHKQFETRYLEGYVGLLKQAAPCSSSKELRLRAQICASAVEGIVHLAIKTGQQENRAFVRIASKMLDSCIA